MLAAVVAVLALVLALGVAGAGAAGPSLSITQPQDGEALATHAPLLAGTTDDGVDPVEVEIHEGPGVNGTVVQTLEALSAPLEETWQASASSLGDGTYTAVAVQTNLLNETGESNPVTFRVDTTAPAVSIEAPETPTSDSTPTLTGGVGQASGDTEAVTIQIFGEHGETVAEGAANVSGSTWSYTPSALAEGSYTARALQDDEVGNKGKSSTASFVIDTTPPNVSISPPASPTKDTTPTLSGAIGQAAGDVHAVTVTIYKGVSPGGTPAASGAASVSGSAWSYTSPTLGEGTYTAVASQLDAAGNEGTSEATFTLDTSGPAVTLAEVTSPTKDTTPTLDGTIGQAGGDVQAVTVTIYKGATATGPPAASGSASVSGSSWSYTSPTLGQGTYTAVASQLDTAGNEGTSSPATFTIDTTGPAVTLAPATSPTKDTSPALSGAIGQATGDVHAVTVTVYKGATATGTPAASGSASVSGSSWSYTSPALAEGTYTAVASQLDTAGNEGTSSPATFTIDTTSPAVTFATVSSPTKDTTPAMTGAIGQAADDVHAVTVTVYKGVSPGGTPAASGSASVSGSSWSYTATTLAQGTYTAVASQLDAAGNEGTSEATFTIDTTGPGVTLAEVTSPTKDTTPTLDGTIGQAGGDVQAVTVTIYKGATATGPPAASGSASVSGSSWSYTSPTLAQGTYTAVASQLDTAGNEGHSSAGTFVIDTTPPALTISVTPQHGGIVEVTQPTISGLAGTAAGDGAKLTLKIYEGAAGEGTPEEEELTVTAGKWTNASGGPQLTNGPHTAVVEQFDAAGNRGSASSAFVVSTATPEVTLAPSTEAFRGETLIEGPTPSFSGKAGVAPEDTPSVTLDIYEGPAASGIPVREITTAVSASKWSAVTEPSLPDGVYTAQAEQHHKSLIGVSEPVHFTIDADAPHVTLTAPVNGSSTSASSVPVSGAAGTAPGDSATVTVRLFAGSIISGQAPLESVSVPVAGGHFATTLGGLSPGTYTLSAQQADDVGNVGTSAPSTVTVLSPPAPPPPPGPPSASFTWFPASPFVGEPVSIVSTSTDAGSPITSFGWSLASVGPFTPGDSVIHTTFTTPGSHVVRLSVTDAEGRTNSVAETIPVAIRTAALMQPFPIVRIAGTESRHGVRISLVSVQAPTGARVTVRCRGRGCPAKGQTVIAAAGAGKRKAGTVLIVFKHFERSLRVGAVLEIRVSKPGQIGKYTRFAVRHGKLPSRQDTCLSPTGVKPMRCPS